MEQIQYIKLSKFPKYTISFYKSAEMGYSEYFGRMEYYSMGGKCIQVFKDNSNKQYTILNYDERTLNVMDKINDTNEYLKILPKDLKQIADYIFEYYLKLKASDSDYGTYVHTYPGSEGRRGIKCLYLHQIFDYILKHQRVEKLNKIFNE